MGDLFCMSNNITAVNCNTNETVTLVIHLPSPSPAPSREMVNLIKAVADKMLSGGSQMPEEFEDVFTMEIVTRPSGSRYVLVNAA